MVCYELIIVCGLRAVAMPTGQKTAKYQSHTRGQNHQSKDVKGKYTKLHLALRNSKNLRFREVYRQPLEWKVRSSFWRPLSVALRLALLLRLDICIEPRLFVSPAAQMLVALGFILSTIYVILEYVVEVPIDP